MSGSMTASWGQPNINQANEINSLGGVCRKCRVFHGGDRSHEIGAVFRLILECARLASKFGLELDSGGWFWEDLKTLSL
jgi:hypothetical protein